MGKGVFFLFLWPGLRPVQMCIRDRLGEDQPDDQRREKPQCHRSHSVDKIALEGFF